MKRFVLAALLCVLTIPAYAQIEVPVDTALELYVNELGLSTDGTDHDETVAYDESGMELYFNCVYYDGTEGTTAVTPTDGTGVYDWNHVDGAIYKIEIPASGGASINNTEEATCWFSGKTTAHLPFKGPQYKFVNTTGDPLNANYGLATQDVNVASLDANTVTAAALATDAVNEIVDQTWEEALTDHSGTGGSNAEALSNASSAGDPWATSLPGAYAAGTAGNIVGNDIPGILLDTAEIGVAGAGLSAIPNVHYRPTNTAATGISFTPYDGGVITKDATGIACEISLDGAAVAGLDTPNITEIEFSSGAYWTFDLIQEETDGASAVVECDGTNLDITHIYIEFQQ